MLMIVRTMKAKRIKSAKKRKKQLFVIKNHNFSDT